MIACTAIVLMGALPAAAREGDREVLRDRIEWLSSTPDPTIEGAPIAAVRLITELYKGRDYEPAWTPKMIEELFDQVMRSVEHGLNPEDFHALQLSVRVDPGAGAEDPVYRADTEILCLDALARLGVTLKFGKLDPARLDPGWNWTREFEARKPVTVFAEALTSRQIEARLEAVAPSTPFYQRLRRALVTYREIEARGGWPPIPEGKLLEPGSTGPRVALLRKRLAAEGDLTVSAPADPSVFDEDLEAAVERFQWRHGIDADGKVGPGTAEELNIPVAARIDQIRATLERFRWVYRDLPGDYIFVDIAGFNAHLVQDGEVVWSTRVQVGKPYHKTPVFKDTMSYIELNPTWTIPPGILRNETLPRVRKDPDYLSRNNMSVVTRSGEIVDPATIDWAATATKGFPHMIRQEPGPDNALGRVKFIFPNKYMVYLHDTPHQAKFDHTERAFSHGCIRTQNPFELATLLLDDQGWDRERIDQVVESRKNTRVNLEEPLTVMLLYWTAEADADGTVHFRRDLYSRDAPIIKGLDEPFRVDRPKAAGDES